MWRIKKENVKVPIKLLLKFWKFVKMALSAALIADPIMYTNILMYILNAFY